MGNKVVFDPYCFLKYSLYKEAIYLNEMQVEYDGADLNTFVITLDNEKQIFLRARDEGSRDEWVRNIQKASSEMRDEIEMRNRRCWGGWGECEQ